jgi:RadC-like JAB domain
MSSAEMDHRNHGLHIPTHRHAAPAVPPWVTAAKKNILKPQRHCVISPIPPIPPKPLKKHQTAAPRMHPIYYVRPSGPDAEVTSRIKKAGEIVGIHLLDHIIFNPTAYFSFLEAGRL